MHRIALLFVFFAGGCVHHQISLQLVDSEKMPVADVEVTLDSDEECRTIATSDSAGHVPTFTARPDDEIKLKKGGFRDTRLVVRSREIEVRRTPNLSTTNPIANIVASFLLEGKIEDTVPIVKGHSVLIEMKAGKGSTELYKEGVQEFLTRLAGEKLSHDIVHSCIQIYPWKVEFPYVESETVSFEEQFNSP